MIQRRLLMGGGGSFLPNAYVGLINGAPTSAYAYVIGPISSNDGGVTFTVGASAVISPGSGWESTTVKDPALVHDGSQFVVFYTGFDGTTMKIGRATASSVGGTWTKYGSNPVLSVGTSGQFDEYRINFPTVIYDVTQSPPWKMWYAGWTPPPADIVITIGFADSSDGITWTKRGQVLDVGTSGDFDDAGLIPGAAIRDGSTWYLYYSGFRSDIFYSTGWATCTDPADDSTYTRGGEMAGYGGSIVIGGATWRSNLTRSVIPQGSGYLVAGTVWNTVSGPEEISWQIAASSLTSWPVPSTQMIALAGWYATSAENPSVVVVP